MFKKLTDRLSAMHYIFVNSVHACTNVTCNHQTPIDIAAKGFQTLEILCSVVFGCWVCSILFLFLFINIFLMFWGVISIYTSTNTSTKFSPLCHLCFCRECGADIKQRKPVHVFWRPGDIHLSSVWIFISGMAQPTHYSANCIFSG